MVQRNIFTRKGRTARAIRDTIGAVALVVGMLGLVLAYFDVLIK